MELTCFRSIARYTLFAHTRNEEILEDVNKLQLQLVDQKLRRYKSNWLRRVKKITTI
jgi:hypothetical protein